MLKVVIIYHSQFGHTEKVAQSIFKGVESVDGVTGVLWDTNKAVKSLNEIKNYNGIIFGAPTYMGSLSAGFKDFMDKTSQLWFAQEWKDKLAGGFTNSTSLSGDKFNSLMQLVTFSAQHSMLWVPLKVMNQSSGLDVVSGDGALLNRVGSSLGVAAQSENDSPEVTPPAGDLKTAEIYGKDFADAALRWNKWE